MIEMCFQDVLDATGARSVGGPEQGSLRGISTDTRSLLPGDLYLSLSGPNFDGNAFIAQALEAGAAGLLLRDDGDSQAYDQLSVPVALHQAPRKALAGLARWQRARLAIPVIGVTGSCGKTTTKELLVQLLTPFLRVHGSPASFNNDIGVPRTLLGADPGSEVLVVEMGTNAPGEIAGLCETAQPTAGILTNVGPAHLAGLGSLEGVAREKSALLASLPADGFCVLNADCRFTPELECQTAARSIRFGLEASSGADIYAEKVYFHSAGTTFVLVAKPEFGLDGPEEVTVPLLGLHMVQNLLAALAACAGLGLSLAELLPHLSSLRGAGRRMECHELDGLVVYDDCYNSNPASAEASVRVLAGMHGHERRVLVLGDMLELGDEAPEYHAQVGAAAAEAGLDLLVTVGVYAADIARGALQSGPGSLEIVQLPDPEEAIAVVPDLVRRGDVVLVKASRGARMERLVQRLLQEPADLLVAPSA